MASSQRERLRELMDRRGLGAVLLRQAPNFAWYTGGGNSRVDYASPEGVADVLVTPDAEYVLASRIEAPRMRDEQARGFEVVEFPWEQGAGATIRSLVGGRPLGADVALPRATDVCDDVAQLRRVLDPDEVERLRAVGEDLVTAMGEAARDVARGMTEDEAAAILAAACRPLALVPTVLLAGADDRIARYRHPLPAGLPIGRRVMLAASAVRWGLYANVTRFVELDEPDPETARRTAACEEILRRMRDEATRPGRTLADAFDDCRRFYAEAGYPDEWRLHHQGGTTGYASREVLATPSTRDPIRPGNAFAWNPSITGAKAEETFVLTESGPEIVASAAGQRG